MISDNIFDKIESIIRNFHPNMEIEYQNINRYFIIGLLYLDNNKILYSVNDNFRIVFGAGVLKLLNYLAIREISYLFDESFMSQLIAYDSGHFGIWANPIQKITEEDKLVFMMKIS